MARFGRDMAVYAAADLLGSSIGLLLSPVFTRLFTPAQYGAQAALGAVWSFVALAQFGGMDSAYPNFRSRTTDEAARRKLLVTATVVAVISALVVSGAFGAVCVATDLVRNFAAVSRVEAMAYALSLAPAAVMAWFLYVLRYEQRAAAFARVSLLGRVAASLVLVPVLLGTAGPGRLTASFLVTAGATALAAGLGALELRRSGVMTGGGAAFDRAEARALLRFGLVLVPGYAIYAASTVLDRMLVTWIAGPAETAVLSLALRLGMVATMLKTWFALVWDPQLIEWVAHEPREALVARLGEAARLIGRAGALLVCLTAAWAGPVVRGLYPAGYWAADRLLPWIVLGVAVSTLSLVAVATTTLARTPKLHLPVYALGLAVNLGVGLWLVPRLGALGAVAAVLAAEIVILAGWIVAGTLVLRNLPLRWTGAFLPLLAAAAAAALLGAGGGAGSPGIAVRAVVSVGALGLFGVPVLRRVRVLAGGAA